MNSQIQYSYIYCKDKPKFDEIKLNFLIFLLAVFSFTAKAETWVQYEESKKFGFIAFYLPTSITRDNQYRTVKVLKTYNKPHQLSDKESDVLYRSTVVTQLINCSRNSYKNLGMQLWSDAGASGTLLRDFDYSKKDNWEKTKENSIQSVLHDEVCLRF